MALASCGWLLKRIRGSSKIVAIKKPREVPKEIASNYGLTSTKEILMNKKLIALAVAGVCVAPAAMAQTTNPVVLYGVVYETLESVEGKGPTTAATAPRRQRVSDQASRLGVRGTEDLGGGLKAFFQLETVFKADQNDSTFANRNSAVGLQGGFGSILMGRWDTPLKVAANAMDPFGDVTLGGQGVATLGSGVGGVQGQFDIRQQNVVQYWSPSWAGFAVRLS